MSYEHHIGDIKSGDIFCEFDGRGYAVRFVAVDNGRLEDGFWKVRGRKLGRTEEDIVEFSVDKNHLHYGPELYEGRNIPYANVKYAN